MKTLRTLALLVSLTSTASAVTVYNTQFDATATSSANGAAWTGAASQDPLRLNPPPPPPPGQQPNAVPIQLLAGGMTNLSQPTRGDFLGFSVELSVFQTLFGTNATHLKPEFLNYLAILQERGGGVVIRVGGNTQDRARIETSLPSGGIIEKYKAPNSGPTDTPVVHFTESVLIAMKRYSEVLNVKYFFGVPFLETNVDGNAGIVSRRAQEILGDSLLGLQLANEPDLYAHHTKKPADYNQQSFFADTTSMVQSLPMDKQIMVGPSVCCFWETIDILNLGYLDMFNSQLKYISAMHYPTNNCDGEKNLQEWYPTYLTHATATDFVQPYGQAVARAQAAGKPFVMLETNTASCGGFPGISDSFAASLWGTDMGLKMVSANFTNAMWHVGGQNVYYNPMTPPPTNQTSFRRWSTGALFYSNIFLAEALGKSGRAQVADLNLGNDNRPSYAIYEDGAPSRVALINFVTDPSGANDYTAQIQVGGGQTGTPGSTPARVYVKYLTAPSASEKWNILWGNQTMGGQFGSDGRLYGQLDVVSIDCADNVCAIPMKSPQAALVFLNEQALTNSQPIETVSFGTTLEQVMTIDWASVRVSNGRNGQSPLGSTSPGSVNSAVSRWRLNAPALQGVAAGALGVVTFCAWAFR